MKKRVQSASRDQHLRDTYGISAEEYDELLKAQGGCCAICGGRRRGNLDVDHDHKTGQVRGLLCRRCNRRLLPASLDNRTVLANAIDYLWEPPALAVIGERVVPEQPKKRRSRRRS